jgi:hypothetical protein
MLEHAFLFQFPFGSGNDPKWLFHGQVCLLQGMYGYVLGSPSESLGVPIKSDIFWGTPWTQLVLYPGCVH